MLALIAQSLAIGSSSTWQLSPQEPTLEVPVRIIQVLDESGKAEYRESYHQVMNVHIAEQQLAAVNALFIRTRIRFSLAESDFEVRKSSYLALDSDEPPVANSSAPENAKPSSTGIEKHDVAFRKVAEERKDRLTLIVHKGSEWRWNADKKVWEFGAGFSREGAMFGGATASYARVCSTSPLVWAHELGHCLGLPHTSRDSVDKPSNLISAEAISAACQAYVAAGGDPRHPENAIDGDIDEGITDTPPDPGIGFWGASKNVTRVIEIHVAGKAPITIVVSRDNIMAAMPEHGGFSYDQAMMMRKRVALLVKPEPTMSHGR